MVKEARKILRAALILLGCVWLVLGQRPARPDDELKLEADLVAIDVVATDSNGNFVQDLKQHEFLLYEDDQPQRIDFFEVGMQITQRPLAAVFALDTSGSIEPDLGQVAEQQRSAEQFMSLLSRDSQFGVITFNNEVKVTQNFTSDRRKILKAFHEATQVGGSTRIYDAVDRAITMLKKVSKTRDGRRVRRVVILITDGFDSASTINLQELIRRASNAGVTVYSITIPNYIAMGNGQRQRAITLLDLSQLIPRSGGMDYSADSYDFTPIFKAIREELAASYTLAYYPGRASRQDGRFHTLTVKTTRPGLSLRLSRQGFQATK